MRIIYIILLTGLLSAKDLKPIKVVPPGTTDVLLLEIEVLKVEKEQLIFELQIPQIRQQIELKLKELRNKLESLKKDKK